MPNEYLFGPLNLDSGTLLRQNRQFKLESVLTPPVKFILLFAYNSSILTNFYYLNKTDFLQLWQFYDQLRAESQAEEEEEGREKDEFPGFPAIIDL